jgi:hypothetical protein
LTSFSRSVVSDQLSGTRTDLRGKPKTDTAKEVGARYGKTDRWVLDAVSFANAVNALKDNVGPAFPEELVQDERPALTRDQVVLLAQAPGDIQREALELVRKRNEAGINSVIEKAKRAIGGTARARTESKSALSKFDLASLVFSLDSWSTEMVESYNPTTDARAMSYLSTHLGGALHKLIVLAESTGNLGAGQVLDDYVARRMQALQATAVPASEPLEPEIEAVAAPEHGSEQHSPELQAALARMTLARPAPQAELMDELREILTAALAEYGMEPARFAKHADVSEDAITRFLAGKTLSYRSGPKVVAALGDLVGFTG